ncbi:hypothetical protein DICPUDRAFT_36311, partial [Dictyostelium purpureum]
MEKKRKEIEDLDTDNSTITYKKFKSEFNSDSLDYRKLQKLSISLNLGGGGTKISIYNRIENYL